MQDIRDDPNV